MEATVTNPLRLWRDNPTALDLLGFADIAAPLIEAINRERLDPVAVGVFGDWGSGKTTVLEILNEELTSHDETIVVYTRPWEYDPTLDVRATLITEVLEALRTRAEKDTAFWEKTKDKFAGLAKRIKWSKAITLASKSAVTFTLPSPEKLIEIFGDKEEVADPTLQGFRKEFAELMSEFDEVKRVVVLVDDLDRCLPESVVMTLEAIKLFLSVQKMAFVVAADEALVKAAIARHFDSSQLGGRMAGDYLEKIIQIPITVPALGQGDTEAYLAMMLLDQHLNGDENALRAIALHCAGRRQQGKPDVFKDMPAGLLPGAAADDLALAGELAPVLFEKLDGNPRRLKRFLNAFWVRSDIAARRGVALSPRTLAKLMVLERIEDDAFGQLLDWLGAGTLAENLRKLEAGETLDEAAHGAFDWWTEMPPKVAATDLAPYLRLAAALRRRSGPRTDLRADLADLLEQLATDVLPDRTAAQAKLKELPDSDRRVMAREIVEAIRLDPGMQVLLSESLTQLLREGTFTTEVADGLKRLDASRVEAALILAIADDDSVADEIRAVVRIWRESTRLNTVAQNAADEVLGGAV
ncbi:KAP family P-loop domain protein [soil metagenome]